jgi:glutamate-1-semialdehyde 2,1-aminomutase
VLGQTLVAPLDAEAALDAAIDAAEGDLAAIILEAVPANFGLLPQRSAWLDHLAARCRAAGALLVLDEVITGFRTGPQGAAGLYGLRPDLVCYGKVIGGGFPVAAYGGRADLMSLVAPAGPVYQAGTLSANPVGMRAGLTTLRRMADANGWRDLETRTAAFCDALAPRLAVVAPSLAIARHASIFWIHQRTSEPLRRPDRIPAAHGDWYARFFHRALERGVYLPPSPYEVCFLSLAHDREVLATAADILVAAAEAAEQR